METNTSNFVASMVFIVLYILAILTVAKLLINSDYKLPEKLQWMGKVYDLPYIGPVAYWFYFVLSGKRKEKHKPHSK